mmetsp:Transcript_2907/g.3323  ORF Transcript_2907/g.3323 Transcript_2907/m.3323 type:complete len:327 (-) Transcript_2907:1876-2856(-)
MKYVIFDFGGVLRIKTPEYVEVLKNVEETVNEELVRIGSEERVKGWSKVVKFVRSKDWKSTVGYGKISRSEAYNIGFDRHGLNDPEFRQRVIDQIDFGGKSVFQEMYSLLKVLKKKPGVTLGILSNHSLCLRDWLENRYDLVPKYFAHENVIISAEIGMKKPDKRVYLKLLETLGANANTNGTNGKNGKSKNRRAAKLSMIGYQMKHQASEVMKRARMAAQMSLKRMDSLSTKRMDSIEARLKAESSESCDYGTVVEEDDDEDEDAGENRIYGIDPSDVLFIDNREDNCESAQELGLATVLFQYDSSKSDADNVNELKERILDFLG